MPTSDGGLGRLAPSSLLKRSWVLGSVRHSYFRSTTSLAYFFMALVKVAEAPSAVEKIMPPELMKVLSLAMSSVVNLGSCEPVISRTGASSHSSGLTWRLTNCQLMGFSHFLEIQRVT